MEVQTLHSQLFTAWVEIDDVEIGRAAENKFPGVLIDHKRWNLTQSIRAEIEQGALKVNKWKLDTSWKRLTFFTVASLCHIWHVVLKSGRILWINESKLQTLSLMDSVLNCWN